MTFVIIIVLIATSAIILKNILKHAFKSATLCTGDNRIFLATTTHTRFSPIINSFKYNLFYFGIRIDKLNDIKSNFLFGVDSWSIFSLLTKDFLPGKSTHPLLIDRLNHILEHLVTFLLIVNSLSRE